MHEFCHCQRAPSSCFPSAGQVWIDGNDDGAGGDEAIIVRKVMDVAF